MAELAIDDMQHEWAFIRVDVTCGWIDVESANHLPQTAMLAT